MIRGFSIVLFVLFSNILSVSVFGQAKGSEKDVIIAKEDTVMRQQATMFVVDTLNQAELTQLNKEIQLSLKTEFTPDPTKAVIYSAIFPGLGQIYNRKYWKLPIIYGGFLGVVYAVTWNGNMYSDYQNAYRDFVTNPYGTTSWHNFVPDEDPVTQVLGSASRKSQVQESLKRRRDYFRRNRDLAIIVGVGVYALCMIDAYVDAHLYNFDVTPDLSMTVAPVVWGPSNLSGTMSVGFQCNITF